MARNKSEYVAETIFTNLEKAANELFYNPRDMRNHSVSFSKGGVNYTFWLDQSNLNCRGVRGYSDNYSEKFRPCEWNNLNKDNVLATMKKLVELLT